MEFIYNDGGRKNAGFKGTAGDCVCRAIAIIAGIPYAEAYARINELATRERTGKRKKSKSTARKGVYTSTINKYLTELGFSWTPTMFIGQGCKIHLADGELPAGRLIVSVSKHLTSVIDGKIHDTADPSRGGKRCVYGYWSHPPKKTL